MSPRVCAHVLIDPVRGCTSSAVYFLEYSIYPGFVDRDTFARADDPSYTSLNKSAYILCWMAYNIGATKRAEIIIRFLLCRLPSARARASLAGRYTLLV